MWFPGKVEIESQADPMLLLVRALAGVVLRFIVGVELDVFAHRQQATRIEIHAVPVPDEQPSPQWEV